MIVFLFLNWRKTTRDPIITELTMSESVTTRKAPRNEKFVSSLGNVMSGRNANDVSISLGSIVRFIVDDIPLSQHEPEQTLNHLPQGDVVLFLHLIIIP
jgi:hypothetical protein